MKYKVITDNLDWYGIQEFAIITFKDNLDIVIDNPFIDKKYRRYCILEDDKFKIKLLLNQHPSWFEKIEEDKFELEEKEWKDFTKSINFMLVGGNDYGPRLIEKQPTLKTEDGKELCDGQVFYCLDTNNIDNDIMQSVFFSRLPRYSNNYKIFSSKEKAEQYIKENKPQFNKKDMIEFAEYFSDNYNHADCNPAYPLAKWLRKRKK